MSLKEKMKEFKEKFCNRESFTPSEFDDPLAQKIEWSPAKRGGASFCTHKLIETKPDRMEFKPALGAIIFYLIFLLIGVGVLVGFFVSLFTKGFSGESLFLAGFGIIFGGIGFWMFRSGTRPIVFDKQYGFFWTGRVNPTEAIDIDDFKKIAKLDDIYAIQLISEYCRGDKSSYYSYEMNLVLENGDRINVTDHGKREKIKQDAETLTNFLGKPLWDAI